MGFCPKCGQSAPAAALFCPSCGNPISEPTQLTEERKLATVLFADLVGSTALADSQDAERTRSLLNRFYDAMATEITDTGGTIEKFVGDAVMAAFGAPAAQEDHAERALHAALSMQRRLEELFGGALSLRIGVNTGDVVAGQPRVGSSFVTGDAVNVAARLEQAAGPGEILVGERTVAAVLGAFEFDEPATVAAKGKADGVACRRLVRALSLMRPRGVGGLRHAFVGRERELEALQQAYGRAVEARQPCLVTIMGDAGIGKTTLIRELWEWLGSQSPEPLRRAGRCISYGAGITYLPLGEIVREHLGLTESDSPETVRRRLGQHDVLGMTLGLEAPADLHPLVARERLRRAWVAFLEELAADQPAVVLIEDLHWAEQALLDLLEGALHDARGPLLVLATARPELVHTRPTWGRGREADTLWLEVLSSSDAARMVDELVPAVLPAAVRKVIVERAEGNPFFVEELVRTLIDQGVLERLNGGWTARDLPDDFVVPDTVQAVLAARIDLLEPAEKAALQAAAVIGRTFWAGPVNELLEDVEADLDVLEERDFIRHRVELYDRRGARVCDQARAHSRGRLRQPGDCEAGPPPCAIRGVARADGRRSRRARGSTGTSLCGGGAAGRRRPRVGRGRRLNSDTCASSPSRGSGAPPNWPSAATRSKTPSHCFSARSSSNRAETHRWRSGGRLVTLTPSTSTARRSPRRCSARSSWPTTT